MSRGGRREGAGRKPDRGTPAEHRFELLMTEGELAEIDAARGEVPRSTWMIQASLEKARRRG